MSIFNSADPAIADSLMLVADDLTEIEDPNLYRVMGTTILDEHQRQLTFDVAEHHRRREDAEKERAVRRTALELAAAPVHLVRVA